MADTHNGKTYFIRVRGRIFGPYDVPQLKALRDRGQFGRANEISSDRQSWQSAATMDHLFGGSVATATARTAAKKEASPVTEPPGSSPPGRSAAPVWHYTVATEQYGPVTLLELRGMVASGQLTPDDVVWKEGMADWIPLRDVPELQAAVRPSAAALGAASMQTFCYACGSPSDPRAELCPKCGVRQTPGGPPGPHAVASGAVVKYAGFWKRLAAFMVDSLLLVTAYWIVHFALELSLAQSIGVDRKEAQAVKFAILVAYEIVGSTLLWWLYHAVMESSSLQGTLGKMAVAAKVTDLNGKRITFARASVRYWGKLLSGAILGIGYLMVAFTESKQGLHDTMAECLVVSKY